MGGESLLVAQQVTKTFPGPSGEVAILRGIDCAVAPGERVAIVGSSGSGKSTLLHILGGLTPPTSGAVAYAGAPVQYHDAAWMARFRNQAIGFVFQFYHLLPELTAAENIMMPLCLRGAAPRAARATAHQWLDRLGLAARAGAYPQTLSGGEQQRVAVARAMIGAPKIILADEPTGNLDESTGAQVIDLVTRVCREQATALVLVTHDQRLAQSLDRVWYLREGHLHEAA